MKDKSRAFSDIQSLCRTGLSAVEIPSEKKTATNLQCSLKKKKTDDVAENISLYQTVLKYKTGVNL